MGEAELLIGRGNDAKTAPYRRADRRRGRRFGGNCQPHPQTPGPRPACRRSSRPNRSVAMNGQPPARSSTSTSKSWASSVGLAIGSRTSGPARAIRAGVGWEHVHLAIDEPFPSRPFRNPAGRKTSVLPALSLQLFNALRFFPNLGVKVERVMTDNGSSFRSHRYAKALRRLKIKHLRTRPYTQGRALRPDHTPGPTAPPNNAPPNCPSGCTATIGIALMAVSAPSHQSAGSAYPGTTCRGSTASLFDGNSNWRGPVWFPLNFLAIESLRHLYDFFGEGLTVELPTGFGRKASLF